MAGVLVERESFLASLSALVEESFGGRGRLVFLGGEAGVGKTALISAFARSVAVNLAVRSGACDPLTTAAPLGPFGDAFPELDDELGAGRVDRPRLLRMLRGMLAREPTLLLIEDVQWADEATLDLLRMLARRVGDLPALVVATFRAEEVPRDHPLTVLLGDVATLPGVARMQLPPLTPEGVRRLVEQERSVLDVAELYRRTGGNPFYVTEVLAEGADRVPTTVRDAVLARRSRLSPPARRVLGAAAMLGQRIELAVLVEVSRQPGDAVDECVRRGMLVADAGLLSFRHELARLAIEQTLPPGERAALHAAALHSLRAAGVRDDRRLAHHAAGCGDKAAVLAHAVPAAGRAARLGAHREAAELYRVALQDGTGQDARRGDLFAALSYECYLTDQLEAAHSASAEAMRLAQRSADPLRVGSAQRWLSRLSWFLGRNDESDQWAGRAAATLEPHGETRELAMAYSNLAQLRMLANDAAEAISWGERALELARRLGDREVEVHALNNVGTALARNADETEGLHLLARSLDMALAEDLHEHAARAYTNLGSAAVINRRLGDADEQLRAGIAYCGDRDLDSWTLYLRAWLARSLAEQGRYDAADAAARAVLRHSRLSPVTRLTALVVTGQLAQRRGQAGDAYLDEALVLTTGAGETQRIVPVAAARAEAAWLAGSSDRIVAEIDRAWDTAVAHPQAWELGELSWWLAVAGDRRESPLPLPRPFALMLAHHWVDAADQWRALGCPLWTALALAHSPQLAHAHAALQVADTLNAPAVREAVLRDRHADRLPIPRGPRAFARANPWGLTAREIDILTLLVDGLTNAEMANRLYLSQKTVGHHVSSILRKLDVPTRSRAVATAIQQGIIAPS